MSHNINIERGFYKTLLGSYTPEQVALIKKVIQGKVQPDDSELFPKTSSWVRSCYNEPTRIEKTMNAIDEVLENHGVESFKTSQGYVDYSNTGDSYALTVVNFKGKLRATSWGDIAEKYATE